jgi:hypothetical protein
LVDFDFYFLLTFLFGVFDLLLRTRCFFYTLFLIFAKRLAIGLGVLIEFERECLDFDRDFGFDLDLDCLRTLPTVVASLLALILAGYFLADVDFNFFEPFL